MSIKVRFILLIFFVLCRIALLAQPSEWGDLFSYYQSAGAAYNNSECVSYSKSTILRYNFQTGERRKLSKVNALSEADIQAVTLSASGTLWVSYASGRIEYHTPDGKRDVYTELETQVLHGLRRPIHQLVATGENSCIGISADYVYYFAESVLQREFRLWGANQSILTLNTIAEHKGKIYVGTSQGVYVSEEAIGLPNYSRFGALSGKIVSLATDNNHLIAVRSLSVGYELWRVSDQEPWTKIVERPTVLVNNISFRNGQILVPESTALISIDLGGQEQTLYDDALLPLGRQIGAVYAFYAPDGTLYVASKYQGLLRIAGAGEKELLAPTSPAFVGCSHVLAIEGNEVVLANGELQPSTALLAKGAPLFYYQTDTNEGTNIYWEKETSVTDLVLVNAASKRFALATSNAGVLIFEKENLSEQYTEKNSPLPAGVLSTTTYINALSVAPDGTLYICAGVTGELFRLSPDGVWSKVSLPRTYGRSVLRLELSKKGILFLISTNLSELTAIDPATFFGSNGHEGIVSQNLIGEQMTHVTTGRTLGFESSGDLWIGTDDGLVRARTPEQILDGKRLTFNATFIYTQQDGQSALFEGVRTDHLVVDAGDRLWLNSPNKGLMLVDPMRRLLLAEHLAANSPIPSNWINALAYEPAGGTLYIATDLGVVALVTTANKAEKDYNDVRIYPNPVRPDFTGLLTIDGLLKDSYVKIVDAGGVLVRELQSSGGRATWDLRNGYGNKVASGVYFVLISHEGTKQGYAGKFAVIR